MSTEIPTRGRRGEGGVQLPNCSQAFVFAIVVAGVNFDFVLLLNPAEYRCEILRDWGSSPGGLICEAFSFTTLYVQPGS